MRASFDTGRYFQIRTAITAIGFVFFQMTSNNTIGTHHDTGPATDTFIPVGHHHPLLGTADGTADTGMHTGGIFTMTAQYRQPIVRSYPLHVYTALGGRLF